MNNGKFADKDLAQIAEILIRRKLELIEQIGFGAQAAVFRCKSAEVDRFEAVKVYFQRTFTEEFVRHSSNWDELQSAVSASSLPYIVTLFRYFVADGWLFTVWECGEQSLSDYQAENYPGAGIPRKECYEFLRDIARGIDQIHELGSPIFHSDIKPSNMIRIGNNAKLMDFGVAKIQSSLTTMASSGGTDAYMLLSNRKPSKLRDFIAFVISCIELRSGVHPYFANGDFETNFRNGTFDLGKLDKDEQQIFGQLLKSPSYPDEGLEKWLARSFIEPSLANSNNNGKNGKRAASHGVFLGWAQILILICTSAIGLMFESDYSWNNDLLIWGVIPTTALALAIYVGSAKLCFLQLLVAGASMSLKYLSGADGWEPYRIGLIIEMWVLLAVFLLFLLPIAMLSSRLWNKHRLFLMLAVVLAGICLWAPSAYQVNFGHSFQLKWRDHSRDWPKLKETDNMTETHSYAFDSEGNILFKAPDVIGEWDLTSNTVYLNEQRDNISLSKSVVHDKVLFTVANGQLVRAEIAENLDLHLWERYFVRDKFIENGRIRTDMLSSLSIDGSELVAVSEDHPHVRSWDLSTGKPVRSFNAESVIEESKSKNSQINYSPNGKLFSVLSRDEKKIVFAIHSTVSSESLFEISFPHETERLHADVFLSNDGRATIATSTELRTWDAFNKIEISRIALNERLIPIGISQDHSMFAGVHYPRWYWIPCSIDIIDINLGKSIRKISLPRAIFGSDRIKLFDNQRLGLIDQDGLRVWTLK